MSTDYKHWKTIEHGHLLIFFNNKHWKTIELQALEAVSPIELHALEEIFFLIIKKKCLSF